MESEKWQQQQTKSCVFRNDFIFMVTKESAVVRKIKIKFNTPFVVVVVFCIPQWKLIGVSAWIVYGNVCCLICIHTECYALCIQYCVYSFFFVVNLIFQTTKLSAAWNCYFLFCFFFSFFLSSCLQHLNENPIKICRGRLVLLEYTYFEELNFHRICFSCKYFKNYRKLFVIWTKRTTI